MPQIRSPFPPLFSLFQFVLLPVNLSLHSQILSSAIKLIHLVQWWSVSWLWECVHSRGRLKLRIHFSNCCRQAQVSHSSCPRTVLVDSGHLIHRIFRPSEYVVPCPPASTLFNWKLLSLSPYMLSPCISCAVFKIIYFSLFFSGFDVSKCDCLWLILLGYWTPWKLHWCLSPKPACLHSVPR